MTPKQHVVRMFDYIMRTKAGKIVIVQFPNVSLLIALVSVAVARVFATESWVVIPRLITFAALAIWALQEYVSGVSRFRKLLGGAVLIYLTVSIINSITT